MTTKEELRERVWGLLEKNKAARFPGARGRIPNFIGAEACARSLAAQPYWQRAAVLKVNPDSPQRAIRHKALSEGKIVYMPVPRLRDDKPFVELDPKELSCSPYVASSIKGAAQYGRLVTLDQVRPIDLVVCGSVAVNRGGARVGKGGGYSDLEFALLMEARKLSARTPIVSSVHRLQVVEDEIPMLAHDIPLNTIITPEEIINVNRAAAKPKGIYWHMLGAEKLETVPILREKSHKS